MKINAASWWASLHDSSRIRERTTALQRGNPCKLMRS
jgi:hypothetical protein